MTNDPTIWDDFGDVVQSEPRGTGATKLTISIDYDDTFTADTQTWGHVIEMLQAAGHKVICVSARRDELGHRQELVNALPDGVPVLLSYDAPKRLYAKSKGYDVDVWIDDMPEAIPTKEEQIY